MTEQAITVTFLVPHDAHEQTFDEINAVVEEHLGHLHPDCTSEPVYTIGDLRARYAPPPPPPMDTATTRPGPSSGWQDPWLWVLVGLGVVFMVVWAVAS